MKLRHILTGITGIFIERRMGYFREVTVIRVPDGREYAAPSIEFEELKN